MSDQCNQFPFLDKWRLWGTEESPSFAVRALGDERFVACKQKINNVVTFYRPEDVGDPTKTNTLGPRFRALDGKVESFVEALTEIAETIRGAVAESS